MLREKVMKLNIDHLKLLCKPQSELCLNQKSQGLFGSLLCRTQKGVQSFRVNCIAAASLKITFISYNSTT